MARTGHLTLTIGVTAVAVIVVGSVVALTRGAGPVAHATTRLGPVAAAEVLSPDGTARPAVAGEVVAPGAVVSTAPGGNAELLTRGRVTLLGGNAVLEVIDGARQQLRTGTAVIDAVEGPGLTLEIASDTVTVPHGSATEADRSVSVRVGSLAGPAAIANSSGRHLAVGALWQAVINGDALPGAPTPLRLNDSRNESRAVPQLVSDDLAMKTLARGINATGGSTAHIIEASWRGTLLSPGVGVSRSEQVLPVAIADASKRAGGTAQQRYDDVVGWRAEGGSWGVVVHLLASRTSAVLDALHSLQSIVSVATAGTGGSGGSISAKPPVTTPVLAAGSGGRNGHGPQNQGGQPTLPPGSGTTPTPKPRDGVVGGLVDTVGGVLNNLLGILPLNHPSKTATPVATPTAAGH